jgi:glycosyltransferase involved in cell wall biosynthesis
MHLLHIIATLDPAAGGTSESVRVLMEHLPPGYTAEALTLDDPAGPFLQALPFPVHALGPQHSTFGYNTQLIPWLRANRHRFDGVVVNGMWQYTGFAAWRALAGHIPYIVVTHGMLDPWFKRTYPLKHLKKWAYWLAAEYWVLRRAYRVLFTTHEEARLARQSFWLHRWRPHVAAIGATRPTGAPPPEQIQAFYTVCPAVRNKRFVLFLGRIHVKKGCDLLIEAFAKVASLDPDLHLVMAGPDQTGWAAALQQAAAKSGIAHRVHWPGMLDGDVKWGAFHASEVFILPSHQENFGIAVAEALACARPALLAAPVNIAPEINEDGAGFMQPDTPSGTEKLLRDWIALTPLERQQMGLRALACFEKRYDMQKNAEAISRLFEPTKL